MRLLRAGMLSGEWRNGSEGSRLGFSLLELVVAMSIMVLIMGAMGALSKAVNEGALYGETYGTAVQHARVAMERIAATVRNATTSDEFPGVIAIEETVGGWEFPDILVVWHPDGSPVDPEGLPRVNELRIYCPNPQSPNELLEVTFPSDGRVVPMPSDKAAWLAEAANMKTSNSAVRTVLTTLLRTANGSNLADSARGVIRFDVRCRPSDGELADYEAGSADWDELAWPQGVCSENVGLRQAWVRIEMQLVPSSTSVGVKSAEETAIPFLGSAACFYEVHP